MILQTVGVHYGIGKHTDDVSGKVMQWNTKMSYAGGFCCIVSLALSKTSFCLTLLRISSGWTRGAVWLILVSINAVLIAHGTIQWVQCWPTPRLWDWDVPGSCMNPNVVQTYNTFSTREFILGSARLGSGCSAAYMAGLTLTLLRQFTPALWTSSLRFCHGRSS